MWQEASKSRDAEGDTPTPILSSLFSQHEVFIDYTFIEEIFIYLRELEGFHLS